MDLTERELLRKIIILEESIDHWTPWHCRNTACRHHMCKVRSNTLHKLKTDLRRLDIRLGLVRYQKRTYTSLGV